MNEVCLRVEFHLNRALMPTELRSLEGSGPRWDVLGPHLLVARADVSHTVQAQADALREMYVLIERAGLQAHEYGPQGFSIEPMIARSSI